MDREDLASLLERVEKAEGPDRELDAAITVALSLTITRKDDLIYLKTARSWSCPSRPRVDTHPTQSKLLFERASLVGHGGAGNA